MRSNRRDRIGVLVLLLSLLAGQAAAAIVSGVVRDETSLQPVEGALVTVQATAARTTTAADGTFSLDVPNGVDPLIVGAKKSYFNSSVFTIPPESGVEILLESVPQSDDPDYDRISPETCSGCHWEQYSEWIDSPMSKAGTNTWVDDIYSGTGTPNGMGGFVYLRDSVFAASNPESECSACHQPELWLDEPFSALADTSLPPSEQVMHGISCEVCHKIGDVNVDNINYPGIFPGALTLTRPENPQTDQVIYGVLGDSDYHAPGLMRASYQPQLVAEVCGACHQDKNDIDEDHSFSGITSEPTYIEWVESAYADPESPHFATCVDCHMPSTGNSTRICTVVPIQRDPETIRSHDIRGTTPFFLENAVEMNVTLKQEGSEVRVNVNVDNSLTGHHVPTGVTVRNMILVVEAWMDGDDPLTAPLEHTGNQVVHELGGVGDPAQGYYAGMAGKFYAKVNHDASGNGPTFFTDATGIQFDSRIPALAVDSTSYTFAAPEEGGLVRVRARLVYRRAFRFLVDAKQWTEDGHGNPLGDVAAPHYGHLMELSEQTLQVQEDLCGNGTQNPGEQCDDGNTTAGDGCSPTCTVEPGFAIPTVGGWGLILLSLLLLGAAPFVFGSRGPR
ncbi:MAG: hypothetical protein GY716_03585 [bacterium]|nr:hypothetical protein [bacterium]